MKARTAEASRTILFMPDGFATLGEQLFRQGNAFGQILPCALPGALDALLLGRDPQFVVLQFKHNFAPDLDDKGLAKGGGYHPSSVLADSRTGCVFHARIVAIWQISVHLP